MQIKMFMLQNVIIVLHFLHKIFSASWFKSYQVILISTAQYFELIKKCNTWFNHIWMGKKM